MGTRATLAVAGSTHREAALASLDAMLRMLESAERELSTWRSDSVLSRLNRQPVGEPFAASDGLCALVLELAEWRDKTDGAFDPAVGALVSAWALRGNGRVPTTTQLEQARARTGLSLIEVTRGPCRVTRRADVTVDAGGFGKGLALDRLMTGRSDAVSVSESDPPSDRWMVDLGGQVAVGPSIARAAPRWPGSISSEGWPVALAHPVHRHRPVLELRIDSGSLAVSGGSERDQQVDGVRVGHILDPRRGVPANQPFAVAVWHPSALAADVLSTALYVMGIDKGLDWAETHDVAVCYLVSATGSPDVTLEPSAAFRSRFGTAGRLAFVP